MKPKFEPKIMEKITYTFNEKGLASDNIKLFLNKLIDENLNIFILQNLSNWIKDQNCLTTDIDDETEKLMAMKKAIEEINNIENIELSITINAPNQSQSVA